METREATLTKHKVSVSGGMGGKTADGPNTEKRPAVEGVPETGLPQPVRTLPQIMKQAEKGRRGRG